MFSFPTRATSSCVGLECSTRGPALGTLADPCQQLPELPAGCLNHEKRVYLRIVRVGAVLPGAARNAMSADKTGAVGADSAGRPPIAYRRSPPVHARLRDSAGRETGVCSRAQKHTQTIARLPNNPQSCLDLIESFSDFFAFGISLGRSPTDRRPCGSRLSSKSCDCCFWQWRRVCQRH